MLIVPKSSEKLSENSSESPGITIRDSSDKLSETVRGIYMYDHAPT